MDVYCRYLRKSREDREAAPGETLARHRAALIATEKQMGIVVTREFEEIVTGDSIAARPQMQAMLASIEAGEFAGVVCYDTFRLARGNSIDQGIVSKTFKEAGALVITPGKTYDPSDEMDEEYFEYTLFMARREYIYITRRMERGREASAKAGLWQGQRPFGYRPTKLKGEKGWSLELIPEERDAALMMAHMFCGIDCQRTGADLIARRLNQMGMRTSRGAEWLPAAVCAYLKSPAPRGFVRRYHAKTSKTPTRAKKKPEILAQGRHPAIFDADLAAAIDRQFSLSAGCARVKSDMEIKNPLSGLLVCKKCGHSMIRAVSRGGEFYYTCRKCRTSEGVHSSRVDVVVDAVLAEVAAWKFRAPDPVDTARRARAIETQRNLLAKHLSRLEEQRGRIFDMLEQGVYTPQVFAQRIAMVDAQVQDINTQLEEASVPEQTDDDAIAAIAPRIDDLLKAYDTADDARSKNEILKSFIARIEYERPRRALRGDDPGAHLTLTIFPRHSL